MMSTFLSPLPSIILLLVALFMLHFNQLLNDFLHLFVCFFFVAVKEELGVGKNECIEGASVLKNDFTVVPLNPMPPAQFASSSWS